MKRYGKIAITSLVALLIWAVVWVAVMMVEKAEAATSPSKTFVFYTTEANPYIILIDATTGWVVDKTTGVPSTDETYAANAITGTADDITGYIPVTIPPLDLKRQYIMKCGSNASPAYTDAIVFTGYYSPEQNICYSADFPAYQGKISIK